MRRMSTNAAQLALKAVLSSASHPSLAPSTARPGEPGSEVVRARPTGSTVQHGRSVRRTSEEDLPLRLAIERADRPNSSAEWRWMFMSRHRWLFWVTRLLTHA